MCISHTHHKLQGGKKHVHIGLQSTHFNSQLLTERMNERLSSLA